MVEKKDRKQGTALNVRQKERRKVWKTIVQVMILLVVGFLLFQTIVDYRTYEEPDRGEWTNQEGFIALSYFGVNRLGTPKHIPRQQLEQQLRVLHQQGYVTISQQDIIDFYERGQPLPEKALFLAFEDGRNDSALYAQKILEKYNFKATILTYADKMGDSQGKFIQPKDIRKMLKTGYWETGSNGYRLTYINIFDREGSYVGLLDEHEADKAAMRYYNHYLMDFIRDEHMIPIEDRAAMEERITADYLMLEDVYTRRLGFVPDLYMIMHANAMYGGMNRLVSDVNSANIQRLFPLHFNREGFAYNSSTANKYDLTRTQVAPYWSTNHLLMKIQKDTGSPMDFVQGEQELARQWTTYSGVAEFKDHQIIVTSPPAEEALLYLKESDKHRDFRLAVKLAGQVVGQQKIYLRYDEKQQSFISVTLEDNRLFVHEQQAGQEPNELFALELDDLQWTEEDLAFDRASVYTLQQATAGAPNDEAEIPINIQHTRELELLIEGNELSIKVDQQPLLDKLGIDHSIHSGGIALGAAASPANKKDDIYDGIFEELTVYSLEQGQEKVVFSNQLRGIELLVKKVKKLASSIVEWAIHTL